MDKINHKTIEARLKTYVSSQANERLSALPHALSVAQFTSEICTHPELGLAATEAVIRLEKFGPYEIGQGEGVSTVKILVRQIANAMILDMLTTSTLETHRSSDRLLTGPNYGHGGELCNQILDFRRSHLSRDCTQYRCWFLPGVQRRENYGFTEKFELTNRDSHPRRKHRSDSNSTSRVRRLGRDEGWDTVPADIWYDYVFMLLPQAEDFADLSRP
jgi:hypothetical protein